MTLINSHFLYLLNFYFPFRLFLNANHEGSGNSIDNSRSNGNIFKIQIEELKSGMSRIKREVIVSGR